MTASRLLLYHGSLASVICVAGTCAGHGEGACASPPLNFDLVCCLMQCVKLYTCSMFVVAPAKGRPGPLCQPSSMRSAGYNADKHNVYRWQYTAIYSNIQQYTAELCFTEPIASWKLHNMTSTNCRVVGAQFEMQVLEVAKFILKSSFYENCFILNSIRVRHGLQCATCLVSKSHPLTSGMKRNGTLCTGGCHSILPTPHHICCCCCFCSCPCRYYALMVVMFFSVSVINNHALSFNIAMPLHMVFRAVRIRFVLLCAMHELCMPSSECYMQYTSA